MQFHRILPAGLALIAVLAGTVPVSAAGYPGTGAPMFAAKKLASDGSDPNNPFSYPFLMDIAKSLARSGLPSGFFLSGDSKQSAVDLRPIILLEAGILRSPVKMLLPGSKKKEDSAPTLSLPTIPEGSTDNPLKPKLESPSLTFIVPPTPRKVDPLSVNLRDFNSELAPNDKRLQVGSERDPSTESLMFRLWTVRDENLPDSKPNSIGQDYRGSFVQITPGALSGIEGRLFQLKQGRALACARGKTIVFDTPIARVSIEPGASAIVEYAGKDALLVRVLESTGSDKPVRVAVKSAGKEDLQVSPKEELLVSTRKITDEERNLLQDKAAKPTGEDTWVRAKFQPSSLLDKDSLLKANLPRMTSEQRAAVTLLRGRLK